MQESLYGGEMILPIPDWVIRFPMDDSSIVEKYALAHSCS